jgi:hypothetical protein
MEKDMSGKEEQMEIDLGLDEAVEPSEKKAAANEEPEVVIEEQSQAEEAPEAPVMAAEDGIDELKRRLEAEKMARLEAEKRARDAAKQAERANSEVHDAQVSLVQTAFDSLKRDQDVLKNALKESMSIGDYDRAAEIQEAMSMNSAKLLQLEHGLNEMKNRVPVQPVAPPPRAAHEMTVDDLIARVNTPLSKNWLINNRHNLPDGRAIRIMARAHEDAIDMGIVPESPEYFAMVESRLGINRQPAPQPAAPAYQEPALSSASAPTQRRSSPAAAPVSRAPVGSNGSRPNAMRLTAEEVEAAKISGLSPREYWELKQKERNRTH